MFLNISKKLAVLSILILIGSANSLSTSLMARNSATVDTQQSSIKKFTQIDKLAKTMDISFQAVRLSDMQTLYNLNPRMALTPASTVKIITAIKALDQYGPTYRFKTEIYYDGTFTNKQISGNIYFKGGGDPLFTSESLWQLAADLKNRGIDQINGNIVIDSSMFTDSEFDSSRSPNKKIINRAYDAPVSAFAINFNTLAVSVTPGSKSGEVPTVSLDPYSVDGIAISNTSKTTSKGKKKIAVTANYKDPEQATIYVSGNIPAHHDQTKIYRATRNHHKINAMLIKEFFSRAGVKVIGGFKQNKIPSGAVLLHTHKGKALERVVHGLNKYSNNYIADVLTKHIGSGQLARGVQVLNQYLHTELKLPQSNIIYNGSGLDIRNRLSAEALVQALSKASQNYRYFPELLSSLAIAGVDGSLEKRFNKKGRELYSVVRAKTGTLNNPKAVAAVSGYMHHPKQGLIAFAVICNANAKKASRNVYDLRVRQEEALKHFYDHI